MTTPSATAIDGAQAFSAAAGLAHAKLTSILLGALFVLLALGLVAVERIGAQPHAEREFGDLLGLERPAGEFGKYRRLCRRLPALFPWRRRQAGDVAVLEVAFLAGPDHHQARHVETRRRDDVERRSDLAGKTVGGGRPAHEIAQRRQAPFWVAGPNFRPSAQNATRTPRKRSNAVKPSLRGGASFGPSWAGAYDFGPTICTVTAQPSKRAGLKAVAARPPMHKH